MNNKFKYFLLAIFVFSTITFCQFNTLEATILEQAQMDKARLEQELIRLEQEIVAKQKELEAQKGQSTTLNNEIKKLTIQINKSKLDIQAKNLVIKKLGGEITEKKKQIESLEDKISRERKSLAQLIRKERQIDDKTILSLLLTEDTISNVYSDVNNFALIKEGIKDSMDVIRGVKNETELQKKSLEDKKDKELDTKAMLEDARRKVEQSEAEKKKLLSISKNQEQEFQKIIADRKAEAARIRSILIQFQGSGVTNRSISFGEAYDYAKKASIKTGVRTALILAIMQQETGFGNNVGGCNLRNEITGEGIYVKSGNPSIRNMVPGNFDNFVKITSSLGMDWKTTPISCAYIQSDGTPYGYGGAMGFTQFIPNTWMLVEARVRSYLNISIANPWNPEHAVMATAIFLQDKGAGAQTYTAEYNSACKYYGSCSNYASSVMKKATNIQIDIDKLENI